MQQLSLIQLQAISGGNSDSESSSFLGEGNIVSKTFEAFKNGLSQSELGMGHIGFAMGTAVAALPCKNLYKALGLAVAELGYIAHSQGYGISTVTQYFYGNNA